MATLRIVMLFCFVAFLSLGQSMIGVSQKEGQLTCLVSVGSAATSVTLQYLEIVETVCAFLRFCVYSGAIEEENRCD